MESIELRRKVLKKAEEEINAFSDKTIRFEERKTNNSVSDIIFIIDTKNAEERMEVYRKIAERYSDKSQLPTTEVAGLCRKT